MTVAVATFNCGNADPKHTPDDLDKIGADVYNLQETFDRKRQIAKWCKKNGFEDVPFKGGWGDTPILYNPDRLKLVSFDSYPVMSKNTNVGPKGAGPTIIHPKFVTHARFRDRDTGRLFNNFNTHLLASWTRNNLGKAEEQDRRELAEKHINLLIQRVNLTRAAAVINGDFNGTKHHPLMKPLDKVVDFGNTAATAHGDTIDLVGTKGKTIEQVIREVVNGTSSDHKPVKATITFVPKNLGSLHANPMT